MDKIPLPIENTFLKKQNEFLEKNVHSFVLYNVLLYVLLLYV